MTRLVLASASPRRRELLVRVGMRVEVRAVEIDERAHEGESPVDYVMRLARDKARAVTRHASEWVLAADTTVTLDGMILGKAESSKEASKMLRWLSGRTHQVLTAFALIGQRGEQTVVREGVVTTDVTMIELADSTLADYVASGEWQGKAGAYAIQGIAAALVREIRGSVTNVIGLPLAEVLSALRDADGPLPQFAAGTPS
ncbi:MAG: nucleoside triphosphate pyrophosphatase [Kofleriaceae bacterium]